MVAIILAFIFLTPREWFRDQSRVPRIAMLPAVHGVNMYWIDPELLKGIPESQRMSRLAEILKVRTGKQQSILRVQPIYDDTEDELKGYMAFTKP
jgi:hypothetical protein